MKKSAILLLALIATLALTTAVQADDEDNFEEGELFRLYLVAQADALLMRSPRASLPLIVIR